MPLTLVTGPANAEKARVVLDALQAAVAREPLLVVPTRADALVYRRELAGRGLVFGVDVQTWSGLARVMARAAGVRGRPVGPLSRERLAALAVARTRLRVLGASAQTPGFTDTLLRFFDELGEQRITPQRWYAAMRAWGTADRARAEYAEDLAALYGAYHRFLETVGRVDRAQHTVAAHDSLRTDPSRWSGRPVFLYGFDDLDVLQLDAVETLVACGASVTVSLPYEAGRTAFAGRAGTYQDLMALGAQETALDAVSDHYEPVSRTALHHVERHLLESDAPRLRESAEAVLLLRGGGERAELELVAAHVARLIADGMPPAEIAIVLRRPERAEAALVQRVLEGYGVPFTLARTLPLGHTALGRGLLAMARCALLDGSADDLLVWLRTPGLVRDTARVDALEADVRRRGVTSAAEARAVWEQGPWKLHEIDRLRDAHRRGPRALCERLAADAMRLFTHPHQGRGAVLDDARRHEARVAGQLRGALIELGALAEADPQLVPEPARLLALLGALEVDVEGGHSANASGGGAVTVADPLAVRARRVRALFVCGLQEGTFPAPGRPEAFLPDADRRAVNAAGGLRLALREDTLGAERYLFYAAVSRPTGLLALSWHDATDDGRPAVRSLLVDDVLDLLDPAATDRVQRRELGAASFGEDAAAGPPAPTEHVAAMAVAQAQAVTGGGDDDGIDALRDPAVLRELATRATWSASALETWVACPVRWFVERHLRPEPLLPNPEPVVRGELAHKVLEDALAALRDGAGEHVGPLRPEHLPRARALAIAALQEHADLHRISPDPHRLAAALHRLQADILRYLEYAAHAGSAYAPAHFELRFGGAKDDLPAVALTDDLALQGRVDRVDLSPDGGRAIVYDYKGATATAGAKWQADGRLQLPLYLLALPQLLGVQVDGGLYQPLSGEDPRPRGLLRVDADADLDCVKGDRAADDEAFTLAMSTARETALHAIGELRAGRLTPRPATCGWRDGGCSYPSICRSEA